MSHYDSEYGGDKHVQGERDLLSPSLLSGLWAYVRVTKPASVLLLVFTAVATMVVAARGWSLRPGLFLVGLAAVTLGCAGANAITCYIDRDMDGIMTRTRGRPIPSGEIRPPERALYWGLLLTVVSLALAWTINVLAFLCGLLGFIDNVLVYSLMMKRRSPLNVILGGFSGGLPALFGWAAVTGTVNVTALLIAALVVLWIPNHIWNLALFHSDDYRKVRVPMLPAVFSLEKTTRCTLATVLLMYACSLAPYFVGAFGPIYLGIAAASGLFITAGNVVVCLRPSRDRAWVLFKLSSPYLFVLFLGMMLDVLVT